MKTALITGITGQDGSYLAEHLLGLGYRVVGIVRRSATPSTERLEGCLDRVELTAGDLLDQSSLMRVMTEFQPDEVYNLAAQSFVHASFSEPIHTGEVTALGVTRLLEGGAGVLDLLLAAEAESVGDESHGGNPATGSLTARG